VRQTVRRWVPPLAWMCLIFVVSAQPTLPSTAAPWDAILKKTAHALAYGILTGLYLRALRTHWSDNALIRVVSSVTAVAYALTDEYHQTFVPGRNGRLLDVVIDAVGIVAATLLDRRHRSNPQGKRWEGLG
jgi:VanZ family protein